MDQPPAFTLSIANLYAAYQHFDLVINSRLVSRPAASLFFALPGARRDGHAYIASLLNVGVVNFVVSPEGYEKHGTAIEEAMASLDGAAGQPPRFHFYEDPARVLQQLAAHHRSHFQIPVVAVTGSNGKTIVKDWLTEVLAIDHSVCASPRSFNSRIGVPLSVWQLRDHHEIAVFEAGIGEPGDMEVLEQILRPTHGILTNVGTAHLSHFDSEEHLIREKMQLFRDVEYLVLPADPRLVSQAEAYVRSQKILAWSGSGREGLTVNGVHRLIEFPDLPGIYLDNARSVVTFCCQFGVPLHTIQAAIGHFVPLRKRLEQRAGRDGGPVINDTYSNDFSALAAAVEFAETLDPFGHLTLILGTVQPLPDLEHKVVALLRDRVQRLLLVGEANQRLWQHFPEATHFSNMADLGQKLGGMSFHRQTVLVKGASYEGLDQAADMLSRQLHRTTLEVDLSALRHNFLTYRALLPAGCQVIVMAKASAYGSGALPVARMLEDLGADYLAVAYPEEGRELRQGGIGLPILVLNAEAYSYPMLVEYGLEPVIHRTEQLRWATNLGLRVHLELETGMGRLGFRSEDFRQLHGESGEHIDAAIASIFTHLAASDDPDHDAYTLAQLEHFQTLYEEYVRSTGMQVKRHALNSNGISRFPDFSYDLVRLGIGLYGLGDEKMRLHLRPALKLTTTVTALTTREAGESVGYGRRGVIKHKTRLAVLSIGYADGLPRLAGEGRFAVRIHNQYALTVGSVCMDMCTVDVTGIPEVRVGDEAVLFSGNHPIELLAGAAQTIPYEILTGIGTRVHRIYVGE